MRRSSSCERRPPVGASWPSGQSMPTMQSGNCFLAQATFPQPHGRQLRCWARKRPGSRESRWRSAGSIITDQRTPSRPLTSPERWILKACQPGFFKDKIVMIGGRSAVGYLAAGRDEFGTPYSRGAHQYTSGLEVHATILLNLLRGEWLTRLPERMEGCHSILVGLLAGLLAPCAHLSRRSQLCSCPSRLRVSLAGSSGIGTSGSIGWCRPRSRCHWSRLVGRVAIPPRITPPKRVAPRLRILLVAANGGQDRRL